MVTDKVSRLERKLNNPKVVLVVGVGAVALNVLLYFGVFLPRMMPLIGNVYSIGASIPESIAANFPEANSGSQSEASSGSQSEAGSKSQSEASSESSRGK